MSDKAVLYYIHDPMCSWCWGFKPVLNALCDKLSDTLEIKFILGGLAADSETAMPQKMQSEIKSNWIRIQQTIPGTEFNFDFWSKCTPRRSTYPSCRAVIAAGRQKNNKDREMIEAIQQAYYLNCENPSDYSVLYQLAESIQLNKDQFKSDIHSAETQKELLSQIDFARSIGANSLPSLYIAKDKQIYPVVLDYNHLDIILEHIQVYL